MNEFKIEKGIPIPPDGRTKWPFKNMEVGDSFLVPNRKRFTELGRLTAHLRPKRFSQRRVDGGIRVWRVE